MHAIFRQIITSRYFEMFITAVIIANAIVLGLETSERAMAVAGPLLIALDGLMLTIFVVEIAMRLVVHRLSFFRDPWSIFDFTIVAIALVPMTQGMSVLRALRVLRVLRLISVIPALRRVVGGLIAALPGMGSIVVLLFLLFYVFSVMATNLYGPSFPEWFGSIGASAYTLFQVMTLESWSMGIVRPVMDVYPLAWAFFVPFILCTSFTVLNLFIGIIVSAMQSEHEGEAHEERAVLAQDNIKILAELKALREEVADLKKAKAE